MNNLDTSYTTIVSNNIEEVRMFAGSHMSFYYEICKTDGSAWDLSDFSATLYIFRYGEPESAVLTVSGVITDNIIRFELTSALTKGVYGVYQQQVVITNVNLNYIPAQGKIIIFPSVYN